MELWQQCAQQLHLKVARAAVEVPAHHHSTMALCDTLSCVSCIHWSTVKICRLYLRNHCLKRRTEQAQTGSEFLMGTPGCHVHR